MSDQVLASRAERVTFFEDRAEVERRARADVRAGITPVSVGGVTALVDDASVVARLDSGAARVLAARVVRRVRQEPEASERSIREIEAALDTLRVRRTTLERTLDRIESDRQRALALAGRWLDGMSRAPRDAAAETMRRWRDAYRAIDEVLARDRDALAKTELELTDVRREEAHATERLRQGRMLAPRYETTVELQIEAPEAGPVDVLLTYRTPCALWRPEHAARLVDGAGQGRAVELTTFATAWQRTGEEWVDVKARFSTARPAQSATPPLLTEDVLAVRKKTDEERSEVVVEAREQKIAVAGLAGGASVVEEMPGVEDGGEPQWFDASRPVTIPSDGQPWRVEVAAVTLPCTVERIAFPERTQAAHLRATATLAGATPLLAGPVRLARGRELVGRGRVSFVGQGEPFEIGFGPDDGVRVRRKVVDERETTAITGTQKVTRSVTLYVSNASGESKDLVVTERVPVSEIEAVRVAVTERGGAILDEKDGFARFHLTVAAGKTEERRIRYSIEASSKVRLPL